jgi:hypothetical protein
MKIKMTKFLILVAGVFGGDLIIGGLLFSILGKGISGPSRDEEKKYTWAGRIIGFIIAVIIVSNL